MGFFSKSKKKIADKYAVPDSPNNTTNPQNNSPPTPEKPKKKRGFFGRMFGKKQKTVVALVTIDEKHKFTERGVGTGDDLIMTEEDIKKRNAAELLGAKIDIRKKIFGAWTTATRNRKGDRLKYLEEQLLQYRRKEYEKKLQGAWNQIEELKEKVRLFENEGKRRREAEIFAVKAMSDLPNILNQQCREIKEATNLSKAAQKNLEDGNAHNPRPSWEPLHRVISLPGTQLGQKLLDVKLHGPLNVSFEGSSARIGNLFLSGADCRIQLKELTVSGDIKLADAANVHIRDVSIQGGVSLRSGSRMFVVNESRVKDIVSVYDANCRLEASDSIFEKAVNIFGGVFAAVYCRFENKESFAVFLTANSGNSTLGEFSNCFFTNDTCTASLLSKGRKTRCVAMDCKFAAQVL